MKKFFVTMIALAVVLAGCSPATSSPAAGSPTAQTSSGGMGMGGNGMMARHHATIPTDYAGLENPVAADEASLARGAEVYATQCATCHGDGGMGDGPAGTALDPAPAPIAHTSQMMSDDYLFWRISEGGAPFNSAMPAWGTTLEEETRWDLINYVRALGAGTVQPGMGMGGAQFNAEQQAQQQAEMLAKAVEQGVLTQEEADIFDTVHSALESYRTSHPDVAGETQDEREAAMMKALVESGEITQAQADAFRGIHDRLGESGLMP